MAEPVRASPFTRLQPGGTGPITVAACAGRALLTIAGPVARADFLGAVRAVLGAELPREAGGVAEGRAGWTYWTGPAEWLHAAPGADGWTLEKELLRALAGTGGSAVDVSQGRAILRLSGPPVRELLSGFCPIDLHPRSFPAGRSAQTLFGKMNVLLHARAEGDAFEITVSRSYADALADAVLDAAREHGCRVGEPVA